MFSDFGDVILFMESVHVYSKLIGYAPPDECKYQNSHVDKIFREALKKEQARMLYKREGWVYICLCVDLYVCFVSVAVVCVLCISLCARVCI